MSPLENPSLAASAEISEGCYCPTIDENARQRFLTEMVSEIPGILAIYRLPDLKLAYLNEPANIRFNPRGEADLLKSTLLENVGLSSRRLLEAEILPQTRVLGRWSGDCDLRDVWGGEFAVSAVFKLMSDQGVHYVCLCAHERAPTQQVNGTRFTDRQLLHALLDYAPDQIYFKDTLCRFLRVSRAQSEKFGLADPALAIGKTDFDFFTSEHASSAYADEQKIIQTGQPIIDSEEMETWENGRVTWVSTTKLPLYDDAGKLIGTFGVSRDITARKAAEAARVDMENKLRLSYKMESIGRLAAGIAHEVNTPTQFITDNTHFLRDAFGRQQTVVKAYEELRKVAALHSDCAAAISTIEVAERQAEMAYLADEIPRCLDQTLEGLSRVARIVCSLKEFAHPNSPHLAPADLNRTIETAVTVTRHEWKYVAEVVMDLAPDLPPVACVVDEINQVMLNLLVNAAHAIEEAQKVRGRARGKITVRTRLDSSSAIIEIEDTGSGMTPEVRARIFEPFYTTKPLGKGTGQGLTIVHTVIVNHHHGAIAVASEPGKGTKFTLTLPLFHASNTATPANEPA